MSMFDRENPPAGGPMMDRIKAGQASLSSMWGCCPANGGCYDPRGCARAQSCHARGVVEREKREARRANDARIVREALRSIAVDVVDRDVRHAHELLADHAGDHLLARLYRLLKS